MLKTVGENGGGQPPNAKNEYETDGELPHSPPQNFDHIFHRNYDFENV